MNTYPSEKTLLTACEAPKREQSEAIVIAALDTVADSGELLELRWGDVDLGATGHDPSGLEAATCMKSTNARFRAKTSGAIRSCSNGRASIPITISGNRSRGKKGFRRQQRDKVFDALRLIDATNENRAVIHSFSQ